VIRAQRTVPPWLRGVRWTIIALGVLVVILTLVALPYTVFPESTAIPREVDAVIVLAGGQGERLDRALASMDRAVGPPASLLLLSNGAAEGDSGARAAGRGHQPRADELCGTARGSYSVACFTPVPNTTLGEARAVARMSAAQGWETVAVVTSTYHVTRARRLLERCFDGDVQVVAATPDYPWPDRIRASLRELLALARDRMSPPEC
jgi:uncharacterized SAM-binding protein YcdF (DUF218 family)